MKLTRGIFCLLLAVLMVFSFTACKKGNTVSELSDEIEYIYQYESAPVNNEENADNSANQNSSVENSNAVDSGNTSSDNKPSSNPQQNSQTQNTQSSQAQNTQNSQPQDTQNSQPQDTQNSQAQDTQNSQAQNTQSSKPQDSQNSQAQNTQSSKPQDSQNSQAQNTQSSKPQDSQNSQAQNTQSSKPQNTQSSQTQNTQSSQINQGTPSTNNNQNNPSKGETYEEKAAKYRGSKVVLATWRDPNVDEDGPVIKAFQKKYGIQVEIDTIGQGGYVNTVASRIAAGDAPDIYFCTATFPSGIQCLQPIDVAEIDLTDPIWDQFMLEKSKVNGKSYLVNTVGNIWNEIACVFYNKKIFRDNNITTPEEYYNAGSWTFETFEKAMREVTEASKDYTGAYIDYNALLGSTGSAYWNWNNNNFSNGVNERFSDVISAIAKWKKDGLIRGVGVQSYTSDFKNGKCGLALCEAWGLKRTGYWRNMNFEDIGFTYLPAFDANSKSHTTGIYRGWGICKGAKNPVAAGVFLRYYLDVNNYDTGSAFITPEAESFFFKLTSSGNMSDKAYYFIGGSDGLATATSHAKIAQIANGDPSQVKSSLNALKNTIESDIKDLNNFIAKQK